MRNYLIIMGLLLSASLSTKAQYQQIDKNKVLDYFQDQQFEEAINYLEPLLGEDSVNITALGFAGYAWYMSDRRNEAEKCYLRMVDLDSNNITANHYLAIIYNNRFIDLAMLYTGRLIRLLPNKAFYYRDMGELYGRLNEKDSALLYMNKAYEMAPNDLKNLYGLANIYAERKEYDRSDSLLQIGLTRDPWYVPFLRLSVRNGYDTKNYQAIITPGERLMEINDVTSTHLSKLIIAYLSLNKYQDCIRVCEWLFENNVEMEAIYYYESRAYARLKDYDKSNQLLAICLAKAISPNGETYYLALGENYEATKQWKKAIAAYDTAYYMYKAPLALYSSGRICEVELKNTELARKYYQHYLAEAKPVATDEKKAYEYVRRTWGRKTKTSQSAKK